VPANRLSTVTFGEERPVAMGHDEESWAKNRRSALTQN
jgi:peptidoglycan-associated lipoprotein